MITKMNKQVDVDMALKRFAEDDQDEGEVGLAKERDAEEEKRQRQTRSFMSFLESDCRAKKNSEYITRDFVDKVLNYRFIEMAFGMTYGGGSAGLTGYSTDETDEILAMTLTSAGPELEPGSTIKGIVGYISNGMRGNECAAGKVFTVTKLPNGGVFEIHQRVRWPGQEGEPPIIEEFAKGTEGKTGKYYLSADYLVDAWDAQGREYTAEATEMVPVTKYNALSLLAAKAEFDYVKSGEAARDKDAGKKRGITLNMSNEQAFEFKIAFDVVAEENEPGSTASALGAGIPEDRIADVFLAVGYTLMDYDIAFVVENTGTNAEGLFMCADLQDTFEAWRSVQLSVENLRACFNALVSLQKMPSSVDHVNQFVKMLPGDATLPSEALRNALNETLHLDGEMKLKLQDIQGVEDEISSNPEKHITFNDFIDIFRS